MPRNSQQGGEERVILREILIQYIGPQEGALHVTNLAPFDNFGHKIKVERANQLFDVVDCRFAVPTSIDMHRQNAQPISSCHQMREVGAVDSTAQSNQCVVPPALPLFLKLRDERGHAPLTLRSRPPLARHTRKRILAAIALPIRSDGDTLDPLGHHAEVADRRVDGRCRDGAELDLIACV